MNNRTELETQLAEESESYSNHLLAGHENEALAELNKIISRHGNDIFRKVLLDISCYQDKIPFKAPQLAYCSLKNYKKLVARLLELREPVNESVHCKDDTEIDNMSALFLASSNNHIEIVQMLLDNNADILHLTSAGEYVLMHVDSPAIYQLILNAAKQRGCLKELLNLKNRHGFNAYQLACAGNRIEELRQIIALENLSQFIDIHSLLQHTRIHAWISSEKSKDFNAICLELRKLAQPRHAIIDFSKNAIPITIQGSNYFLFGSLTSPGLSLSKTDAVKNAILKYHSLLYSPNECKKYLKYINDELARYYRETHKNEFPRLDPATYEFRIIDGTYFPIPKSGYSGVKKSSALQEYLISLFNRYGLANKASKWYGFVPAEQAARMIAAGDFYTESRLGMGLFHNKISHMLQRAILIYALEHGEISLTYIDNGGFKEITLNDIIHGLVTIKPHDDHDNVFVPVCDHRNSNFVTFADPHRLGSVIMHDREELGINVLADAVTDTFCKGFLHFLKALNQHTAPFVQSDANDFVDKMNDLQINSFFIPTFMTDYSIWSETQKGNKAADIDSGPLHAVIPKAYHPNPDFVPEQFKPVSKI